MLRNLCFVSFIINSILIVCGESLYSIVGPGIIRSNYKYNVAVSLHQADVPCRIEVGISSSTYSVTKTIDIQPMSTENVQFDVPKLVDGTYKLTAKGISGISFENSTTLDHADYKPTVFIQTDKATYKPGDLVQFRVLLLDQNTRPAVVETPITILIFDGASNRIKQILKVKLTKGVYTGNLQLSEQPVLGIWKIEVNTEDETLETKSFEVAKYVLPKFEVTIDVPQNVAITDGVIKMTVRSKYTFGKSVKGKATISVWPEAPSNLYNNSPLAQKTIEVNGKGHVEFDLQKDFAHEQDIISQPKLHILAVVDEELTGNKQNATKVVTLRQHKTLIKAINAPKKFRPGAAIIYTVVVQNLDGSPVQDTNNSVKLNIDILEFVEMLDGNGMATFNFTLPKLEITDVYCTYQDHREKLTQISHIGDDNSGILQLVLSTSIPQLGQELSIEVKSTEPLNYFVYTITARGNILKAEHVVVPNDLKSYAIKIMPTFEMIPKATIFVQYIHDKDLRFEEKSIEFEKDYENSLELSTTKQSKPGDNVEVKISTQPNSFVGLLGVDQSVLLLKLGNDLNENEIFSSLNNYETKTPTMRGSGRYPGKESGLVTLTNANYPYKNFPTVVMRRIHHTMPYYFRRSGGSSYGWGGRSGGGGGGGGGGAGGGGGGGVDSYEIEEQVIEQRSSQKISAKKQKSLQKPTVRKEFQESWIFADFNDIGQNVLRFTKKIPDTITSWVITGFSVNPEFGIALTKNPTKIQVFQPFFISINLPYSVKRAEVISIPVLIFNYMSKTLDAEVIMDNTENEYEFTEATNEIEERPIVEVKRVKRISIPSNSGKSVSFMIRPKYVGITTLKITALSALAGDSIEQKLNVEPEGVTQYQNRAYFINLIDGVNYEDTINVDIPRNAVFHSEFIEFSAIGDLIGVTIKNIDKLVRMPVGCGEQNMINFVPNILVLKYLQAVNQSMPSVEQNALKFLEIGYQRELGYKHQDGSYSAFGMSDARGSTWLTAYVARSFQQAKKYSDIDTKLIAMALDFLCTQQLKDGSFQELGRLVDFSHQNIYALSAFVMLAFQEDKENYVKYENTIQNGLKYLRENMHETKDTYSLSIAALVLQQAKDPKANEFLSNLLAIANNENDHRWWSKMANKSEIKSAQYASSNDVEITSYVLLAMLEGDSKVDVLPIIKWLVKQRNSNGGFASTQDTVVGLQALSKFAETTGLSGKGQMEIEFTTEGLEANDQGSISVSPENSLVLMTHVLPKSTRTVKFMAKGNGAAMVQLAYRYNIAEKGQKPSFNLSITIRADLPPQLLHLDICAEFVPPSDDSSVQESNMAVMEIALPSGFTADIEHIEKIKEVDTVMRTDITKSDTMIILYFDYLAAGHVVCVPIKATRTHAVAKQKPAAVVIYDYYSTERRATEYYSVKTSLCDICEDDECGTDCVKK